MARLAARAGNAITPHFDCRLAGVHPASPPFFSTIATLCSMTPAGSLTGRVQAQNQ